MVLLTPVVTWAGIFEWEWVDPSAPSQGKQESNVRCPGGAGVDVLLNGPYQFEADMNGDGVVNGVDVDPFVGALVSGSAAAVPEPLALALAMLGMIGVAACCRRQRR